MKIQVELEVCDYCKKITLSEEEANRSRCHYCSKISCRDCFDCGHTCKCGAKKRTNSEYCSECKVKGLEIFKQRELQRRYIEVVKGLELNKMKDMERVAWQKNFLKETREELDAKWSQIP
jgi:hypothetical protein